MTDVAPFTPEELVEARKLHVADNTVAGEEGWCRCGADLWPCDAARAIATVDALRDALRAAYRLAGHYETHEYMRFRELADKLMFNSPS